MKQLKIIGVVLGLLATLNMAGCATIMSGGPTKMNVTSNPPGAKVTIIGTNNGEKVEGITPFTVGLNKNSDYKLNFEMDGYNSETVSVKRGANAWALGNIITPLVLIKLAAMAAANTPPSPFFAIDPVLIGTLLISATGGVVGIVTDIASNNISQHDKDHIDLTLTKVGSTSSAVMPIGKK